MDPETCSTFDSELDIDTETCLFFAGAGVHGRRLPLDGDAGVDAVDGAMVMVRLLGLIVWFACFGRRVCSTQAVVALRRH